LEYFGKKSAANKKPNHCLKEIIKGSISNIEIAAGTSASHMTIGARTSASHMTIGAATSSLPHARKRIQQIKSNLSSAISKTELPKVQMQKN
jgi:hypothetical protein